MPVLKAPKPARDPFDIRPTPDRDAGAPAPRNRPRVASTPSAGLAHSADVRLRSEPFDDEPEPIAHWDGGKFSMAPPGSWMPPGWAPPGGDTPIIYGPPWITLPPIPDPPSGDKPPDDGADQIVVEEVNEGDGCICVPIVDDSGNEVGINCDCAEEDTGDTGDTGAEGGGSEDGFYDPDPSDTSSDCGVFGPRC